MGPTLQSTELKNLVDQMKEGMFTEDPDTHAAMIATMYEERIRRPTNLRLGAGDEPLPPWTKEMIKAHLNSRPHPVLVIRKRIKQVNKILDTTFHSMSEVNTQLKTTRGRYATRTNKDQWRVYNEAAQYELRLFGLDLRSIGQKFDAANEYLRDPTAMVDATGRSVTGSYTAQQVTRRQ